MELKIINETENPLFNRKEIQLSLKADTTPSREEVVKIISEKFSIPVESIKIKKISGKFGSKVFTVTSNIYSSEEDKNKIESKSGKREPEKKIAEADTLNKEVKKEHAKQASQKEDSSLANSNKLNEPASEQSKE